MCMNHVVPLTQLQILHAIREPRTTVTHHVIIIFKNVEINQRNVNHVATRGVVPQIVTAVMVTVVSVKNHLERVSRKKYGIR